MRAVTGIEYRSPSTTAGAPKRRMITINAVPIATIAPKVTADVAVETGVTKVAAAQGHHQQRGEPRTETRIPAPTLLAKQSSLIRQPQAAQPAPQRPAWDAHQRPDAHDQMRDPQLRTHAPPHHAREQRRDAQLAHQRAHQNCRENNPDQQRPQKMEQPMIT